MTLVHPTAVLHGRVVLGKGTRVDEHCVIGGGPSSSAGVRVGVDSRIRSHSVIYGSVRAGARLRTGHRVLIREGTTIGRDVLIGTDTVLEGDVMIGHRVSIQTRAFVPTSTRIGSDVFIGPGAILTNDRYPIRQRARLLGPVVEDGVSIGAGAVVLPGVVLGRGSFVAAGAVVTSDVPPFMLAIGVPAQMRELPVALRGPNRISRPRRGRAPRGARAQ